MASPVRQRRIALEDRCHLNSMAMVDGQPEYVTAFGAVRHL